MSFITEQGRKSLEGVAAWLEAGAPHIEDKGIDGFEITSGVEALGDCGTTCCIAGAVVQFNDPRFLEEGDARNWTSVYYDAIDVLGISEEDAVALFLAGGRGMSDDQEQFAETVTPVLAAKVIRNYLATGEVDWSIE